MPQVLAKFSKGGPARCGAKHWKKGYEPPAVKTDWGEGGEKAGEQKKGGGQCVKRKKKTPTPEPLFFFQKTRGKDRAGEKKKGIKGKKGGRG